MIPPIEGTFQEPSLEHFLNGEHGYKSVSGIR